MSLHVLKEVLIEFIFFTGDKLYLKMHKNNSHTRDGWIFTDKKDLHKATVIDKSGKKRCEATIAANFWTDGSKEYMGMMLNAQAGEHLLSDERSFLCCRDKVDKWGQCPAGRFYGSGGDWGCQGP